MLTLCVRLAVGSAYLGTFDRQSVMIDLGTFDCQSVMLPCYVRLSVGNAYLGMFDCQPVMLILVCSTVSR